MKKNSQQTQLTPLETALQRQFSANADNYETLIKKAYDCTAKLQSANIAAMVGFGLLALSIRPQIGYGKFGEWLSKTLGGALSKSTAYSWIKAAEWLIYKISVADKQTDIIATRICDFIKMAGIKNGAEEIFGDKKLSSEFIAYVSSGLPFKTFLNILKTANAAALEAEDEENNPERHLSKKDLKALSGDSGEDVQLNFFNEIFEDFRATIEVPRKDKRFTEMPRVEMEQLGNYLIAQGKEIVEIAKSKKD